MRARNDRGKEVRKRCRRRGEREGIVISAEVSKHFVFLQGDDIYVRGQLLIVYHSIHCPKGKEAT